MCTNPYNGNATIPSLPSLVVLPSNTIANSGVKRKKKEKEKEKEKKGKKGEKWYQNNGERE